MPGVTRAQALKQLRTLAQARALGRHVGSDRLIQAAVDALLADIDSPSLPLLAGLGRCEEHCARELFDHVEDELGIGFEAPADPTAAKWALAYWLADQVVDGSLDPAIGADLIWAEVAMDKGEALRAALELVERRGPERPSPATPRSPGTDYGPGLHVLHRRQRQRSAAVGTSPEKPVHVADEPPRVRHQQSRS